MKDDLHHDLTSDLREQTRGTVKKIDELGFKVSHLTSQTGVLEKIRLQKILHRSDPQSPIRQNCSPPTQSYSGCFECGDPDHFARLANEKALSKL